jgi:pimeloyl-ACP methyl ester carboxylesterase
MNSEAERRTLEGVRAVALDRPGFDLSEPARVPREFLRDAAVEFLDEVLDALGLQTSALAGNSMGGLGPCGTRLRAPNGCAGSCCSDRPRCCPARALRFRCASGRAAGRRPAAPPGQAQPRAAHPVDGVDGREGHHRPLLAADRVARSGRPGTDQLGREPRRAPGNHLPFPLPALGEDRPRRAAAADRRDVAVLWLFFGSGSARRCHA